MQVYTFLTEDQFEKYSTCQDPEINEILQEVRNIHPVWFIQETVNMVKNGLFLFRAHETVYTIYELFHYPHGGISRPEVRLQMSNNKKENVISFLNGLYFGYTLKP